MEKYRFTAEQQALMERLPIPFAVFQLVDQRIVTIALSDGFCALLGVEDHSQARADMDRDTFRNVHPDDVARVGNAVYRFMRDSDRFETIYRLKRADGHGYSLVHAYGQHVYTDDTRLAYVWYADEGHYSEDDEPHGTELSRSLSNALHEESLIKASYYDFLTGLPSMTYFFELATTGKDALVARGGRPALMYTDFIGMKYFNTRHGFAEGDKLLKAFARTLIDLFGAENCCHISGDHFAVFAEEKGLAAKLRRLLTDCHELNGGSTLPVHIGVYLSQQEDIHASEALDRAKLACSAIQGHYGTAVNYYSPELSSGVELRQYIIENLDRAMAERWIQVYYQPIVRAVNERVCDEEALARWIDPEQGFLNPGDFIPALEDAGLIYKLDLYVLDRILEKIKKQQGDGLHIMPHSLNLSRSDFDACDIVEEIRARVDAAGIPRDRITIEITESIIGSDFDFMKAQVQRFQSLGFPVWMDDFGSGYSSLDVLQSIKFDLLKFDMSFMRKLDEDESSKVILTELMKMATALDVDTVCEGVETEEQVRFLQEIGCSKLQGFYFCKPIPPEQILDRNRKGIQIGYENPEESAYYESMGRVNLYDLSVLASEDENAFQNAFSTVPMGIIEVRGDTSRFVRSNPSYRDFMKRFFNFDLSCKGAAFAPYDAAFMRNVVRTCCEQGSRAFYDEQMPDGAVVHSFARRIGINPINGNIAVAVAVLSVTEPDEGATYADIARALAADYYYIYMVDMETERFIEYSSSVGAEELAMERHGERFFAVVRQESDTRIHPEDREPFLAVFTKANIIKELDGQGVFMLTYRLIERGVPVYVNMKITRMRPGDSRIIIGISIVDSQMKQKAERDRVRKERDTLARVMALSEDYLSLYSVDPKTGRYIEYSASDEYETLGLPKDGTDFFRQGIEYAPRALHPDDLPAFLGAFNKENVLDTLRRNNVFKLQYRLVIHGRPRPVSLKIAPFTEEDGIKLVAGVRAWQERR